MESLNAKGLKEEVWQLTDAYRSMFNHTNDAIVWFDRTGRIFHFNKRFIGLLGSSAHSSFKVNIFTLLGEIEKDIRSALLGSISEKKIELKIAEQSKQVIVKLGPLYSSGTVSGGYAILIDVTAMTELYQERESRLRQLINEAGIGMVVLDQNHRVLDANQRFAEMLGYEYEELFALHTWDWEADMPPAVIQEKYDDLANFNAVFETRHRRKDGTIFNVEISAVGTTIEGPEGKYNAVICMCQDITERKRIEKQLKISEQKYRSFVENASDIIVSIANDGTILYVSPNCEYFTGFKPEEVEGKKVSDFIRPEERAQHESHFKSAFLEKRFHSDYQIRHKDGSFHWYSVNYSLSEDEFENSVLICHVRNIDERKEYEEQLKYLSTHDQLTGVFNRTFFEAFLEQQGKRREYPVSLLMCDLDGLKEVNDTYGHAAGDELIKACVKVLQASLRQGDFLARIGGDEFAVILPSTNAAAAQRIVSRIYRNVEAYNELEQGLPLSFSVGSATLDSPTRSLLEVLREADKNMYALKKERGKNRE